jgi:hypothetical protein
MSGKMFWRGSVAVTGVPNSSQGNQYALMTREKQAVQ